MQARNLNNATRKASAARALFEDFITKHTAYEGQLSICPATFKRELMTPILTLIKNLEDAATQ